MKKINLILVIILFVIAGCKQSGSQSNELIVVDVTASYPKKDLVLQDFMDVEYVALETNDEFLTVAYVQVISKDIILVRNTNQVEAAAGTIFLFDRNGKGLRKIYRKGQGGEEYLHAYEITLDEDNNEMFVNDFVSSKVKVYDLFGTFKRSFKHKEGRMYRPIYNFDKDNLICHDFTSGFENMEPQNIFWIISKQDGSVIKEVQIPYEKKISKMFHAAEKGKGGMVSNLGLTPYHGDWILTEPSADTIYIYSSDHVMEPFIVRTPSVQSMNPEIFLFPGVVTDRYCFLQTVKKEYSTIDPWSNLVETELVYDRDEKKIFEYVVYNDDFTNKRPINNLVNEVPVLTVINDDEIAFAEVIDAGELVEAYKEGGLKGRLKEVAAGLDEESNPVIMLAKYKK